MMSPNVEIKPLNERYLEALLLIEQEVQLSPWSQSLLNSAIKTNTLSVGAYKGEQLLGYCFVNQVLDEMTLENISISQRFQGQGIAGELLAFLFSEAVKRQVTSIWLEVRESNDAAISLYLKHGFSQKGIRKNYYPVSGSNLETYTSANKREHALLFEKNIT